MSVNLALPSGPSEASPFRPNCTAEKTLSLLMLSWGTKLPGSGHQNVVVGTFSSYKLIEVEDKEKQLADPVVLILSFPYSLLKIIITFKKLE